MAGITPKKSDIRTNVLWLMIDDHAALGIAYQILVSGNG